MHQGCPFVSRNPLVSAKHSRWHRVEPAVVPGPREPGILWHMVTWRNWRANVPVKTESQRANVKVVLYEILGGTQKFGAMAVTLEIDDG